VPAAGEPTDPQLEGVQGGLVVFAITGGLVGPLLPAVNKR
jgi:hypothetical protein